VSPVGIREARPTDYDAIIGVASDWWGRDVSPGLPRLFLDHFWATSLVAEQSGELVAFLVAFQSPSEALEAYIHYVAVRPAYRRSGLARQLYETFFERASANGCVTVRAITSPANELSILFHRGMGFTVTGPIADYNGPGEAVVAFSRSLP
jgi:ribosomal protein S18 acetylase RimI-like enzyme